MFINPKNQSDLSFDIYDLDTGNDGMVELIVRENPLLKMNYHRFLLVIAALGEQLGDFAELKTKAEKTYTSDEVAKYQVLFSNVVVSMSLMAEIGRNTKIWCNMVNERTLSEDTANTLYLDAIRRGNELLSKLRQGLQDLRSTYEE